MLKVLVAILMLVSTGAVLTHGCNHDSVSHDSGISVHVEADHEGSPAQDDSSHETCCQFHCHQHASLASLPCDAFGAFDPRDLSLSPYEILYTDPSLALLTRPPLAS